MLRDLKKEREQVLWISRGRGSQAMDLRTAKALRQGQGVVVGAILGLIVLPIFCFHLLIYLLLGKIEGERRRGWERMRLG